MPVRTFTLDASALAAAHCSGVLALHEAALGGTFSLAEEPPPAAGAPAVRHERVRVISISGPLQTRAQQHMCGFADGYDAIVSRVGSAFASAEVDAVVLDVLSPGGDAVGNLEAARRLRQIATESGKPLLAAVTMGYSAAYALASAAESIFVMPSGGVGSIGTIAVHVSEARALANEGLDVTILRSDPTKAMGHPAEALSEEARAELQRRVDTLGTAFRELVSEHRGLSAADLDELGARTRHGSAAVDGGLADGVGSLDDVVALAAVRAAERAAKKERDRDMAYSANFLSALGLPAGASDAAVEAATLPLLGLARFTLESTGAATPDAARGVMSARFEAAAAVPDLRARLDTAEREKLLEAAVRDRKLDPAQAWSWTVDAQGNKVRGFSAWAGPPRKNERGEEVGQTLGQLRADLDTRAPASFAASAQERRPGAGPAPADQVSRFASSEGVSPDIARQALEQVQAALRAQGQA
ncbi:S49 family peptidase [Sorangium sp. So ce1000]|uniref:S49 family peptidase n=1 Tax=Sorangium sp. So ce1000 TaxID=3133325 RepID=UPI003F626164